MAKVDLEIEVTCGECGSSLDARLSGTDIEVIPCLKCLEEANKEGYDRGYNEGSE